MAELSNGHGGEAAGAGLTPSFQGRAWLTHPDRSALLQAQAEPLIFTRASDDAVALEVDPASQYQTMDGFGFALTGGSAELIARLPHGGRQALLQELFTPEGVGVSLLRLSLGASDLSARPFSYDDPPPDEEDWNLNRFDLFAGDAEVAPLLREILAVNPALKIIATPWSAPLWMKTNRLWIGGSLRPECYPAYAQYFVKYLQAMQAQGIPVQALTPQNEPLNADNEPSMLMAAEEQAVFVKAHLGPALAAAGFGGVEIFCWDHNCDRPDYPLAVLADPAASAYIAGVAWHLYGGDIAALSAVQAAHPGKKMYFTEQWVGRDGQFGGDLHWHVKNVLVGACRHWSRAVVEWNLASDPDCGPHTPGGAADCVGALTLGSGIQRNVAYYVIGHAAKWVRPGSRRVFSAPLEGFAHAAFATPEGLLVLIVLNESAGPQAFKIRCAGYQAGATLAGGAVGTYVWPQ